MTSRWMVEQSHLSAVVPTWSASLLQCIGASGIGILVGVAMVHPVSPVFAQELFEPLGLEPTPEQIVRYKSSLVHFWTRNHAFDFAMLGTTFGISLGLLTTSWKRVSSALAGGVLGLVSGAFGGYLASRWAVAAFIVSSDQSLFRSIALDTIIWGGLQGSVAMGIGFVQGHARIGALGLAGILSSIVASAIFLTLFSVAFPASDLSLEMAVVLDSPIHPGKDCLGLHDGDSTRLRTVLDVESHIKIVESRICRSS